MRYGSLIFLKGKPIIFLQSFRQFHRNRKACREGVKITKQNSQKLLCVIKGGRLPDLGKFTLDLGKMNESLPPKNTIFPSSSQ